MGGIQQCLFAVQFKKQQQYTAVRIIPTLVRDDHSDYSAKAENKALPGRVSSGISYDGIPADLYDIFSIPLEKSYGIP